MGFFSFRRKGLKKKKNSLFTAVSPTIKQCPIQVVISATEKDLTFAFFLSLSVLSSHL